MKIAIIGAGAIGGYVGVKLALAGEDKRKDFAQASDETVICPLHHWTFDLKTGRAVLGVPDEKVAVYETKVENGEIFVKLSL